MSRCQSMVLAGLILLSTAWAQQTSKEISSTNVAAEIERLQSMRTKASLQGDAATLGLTLPNGFTMVGPNGVVFTKSQIVQAVDTGALTFDAFTFEDTAVQAFSHGARVTGHYTARVQYNGANLSGRYRFRQVVTKVGEQTLISFETDSFVGTIPDSGQTSSLK